MYTKFSTYYTVLVRIIILVYRSRPYQSIEIPGREGPRSQGASWGVCGSGVPPYDFLNLYGVFGSKFTNDDGDFTAPKNVYAPTNADGDCTAPKDVYAPTIGADGNCGAPKDDAAPTIGAELILVHTMQCGRNESGNADGNCGAPKDGATPTIDADGNYSTPKDGAAPKTVGDSNYSVLNDSTNAGNCDPPNNGAMDGAATTVSTDGNCGAQTIGAVHTVDDANSRAPKNGAGPTAGADNCSSPRNGAAAPNIGADNYGEPKNTVGADHNCGAHTNAAAPTVAAGNCNGVEDNAAPTIGAGNCSASKDGAAATNVCADDNHIALIAICYPEPGRSDSWCYSGTPDGVRLKNEIIDAYFDPAQVLGGPAPTRNTGFDMKVLHVFDNGRRQRRILSSYDMPLGDVPSFYTEVSAVRTSRNWHKYVTEVFAVNTSRNWHKDSRKRDPTNSFGQAMPSYPDDAVMEQLMDYHRVSHMETSLNLSGMQPNSMCRFWGPAKELSQDIDVLVVVGVAINCCEDQITHIVESSDHGYIASLISFETTIDNLILRLRNIGSLVPEVIQKISLLMNSYTPSEKWQSLVNPFRGVSREVPMLISDKNWLLSVEPFRG